jgi:hypothetical protein
MDQTQANTLLASYSPKTLKIYGVPPGVNSRQSKSLESVLLVLTEPGKLFPNHRRLRVGEIKA